MASVQRGVWELRVIFHKAHSCVSRDNHKLIGGSCVIHSYMWLHHFLQLISLLTREIIMQNSKLITTYSRYVLSIGILWISYINHCGLTKETYVAALHFCDNMYVYIHTCLCVCVYVYISFFSIKHTSKDLFMTIPQSRGNKRGRRKV